MSNNPPPPDVPRTTRCAGRASAAWAAFERAHLFDYNAAATRVWLGLVLFGAAALILALAQLATLPWTELAQVQLGIGFVALSACCPVQVPRTRYSIGVGDVFVLALLAMYGPAAGVMAATVEGAVGGWRSSKRLTSRLANPAAAALGMSLTVGCFGLLRGPLSAWWGDAAGLMAALTLSALPYFAGLTLPLMAMMAAKRGARLSLADWWANYAWFAAVLVGSAAVAGVLVINAQQFGGAVVAVAAAAAGAVVALLNTTLARQEAEHRAQEGRIAEAQREAELNQQRFTAAFSHAAIGMAIVGREGTVLQVNQALMALVRRREGEIVGRPFESLLNPGDAALFHRRVNTFLAEAEPEPFSMELRCIAPLGVPGLAGAPTVEAVWVALHCSRFTDPTGRGASLIYQLHDITSRRLAEDELHHIAYHDDLTDLANRNCFHERLAEAVERSRTDPRQRFAVMFLDLDRFKLVNDSLGHHAGNVMLKAVAQRLVSQVRPGDLVARLGGDEFAVLLESVHDPEDALRLAQRLLDATGQPLQINGTEVVPGASVGITFSDMAYRSMDEVLRDADLAMYEAKARGRHCAVAFDAGMHERITERLQLEGDLRRAIGEGQLSIVYQPLYELEPRRLTGFEALARWNHPVRGPVSPAVFIAVAEESGHIGALTAWVIDEAARQLAEWQVRSPDQRGLSVNVNISSRDLCDQALVTRVAEVLARHALTPGTLTLEITETTLMGRLDTALDTLGRLRALGVGLSIDDFGTGYSSLAYLSRLPIDSLKIDRSFVMGMDRNPQNVEIVRAVLNLGHTLNKRVVAEGIETAEQLATLREIGVTVGQGYLLSRPLRADQVDDLILAAQVP